MKQTKQNHTEKQTEQVDHVRRYQLYVVILRDNSNYFVGNVRRHENGTIFIENEYETFIPTEQIFAEVAISPGQFTVFKHLNAADLLTSLKQIANEDIGRLEKLGKKKVVKRPTKHLADAQTHRAQTSSGYLGSSLGYLGSLLDPISVKDWLYGKTNTLNREKLRIDQSADVGIRTVMQAGERGGAALGKYIETRKRTAALANTSEQKVSHAYDSSESSSSEDSSSKEEKAAPTSPPTNRRQERLSRKLDNYGGGGYIHKGFKTGRKGLGHQPSDEERREAQRAARDKRTSSRRTRAYERIKKGRQARDATAQKKKNNLFAGFKQFVSL